MNNIQKTAIRLIANAFLFAQEKQKPCHSYRFDSSFLSSRGITSIEDLQKLQEELSKRGYFFNIISFNDYIIHEKFFLAEMTKLGFGRVKDKSDAEAEEAYCNSTKYLVYNRIADLLQERLPECNVSREANDTYFLTVTNTSGVSKRVFFLYQYSDSAELTITSTNDFCDSEFKCEVPFSYVNLKEFVNKIVNILKVEV